MRPVERLAVDVLLEQALAHHQAEILARAPPRRIGGLVDDVAQVVEPAGIGRLAGREPGLARLPALPGARGEAEDLDLDAAALQRARQDVGAGRRHRDRPAAHRAGIVEQQGHHRVAEGRVLLVLEGERMHRVDDDARQPRRIEHAFLEVEFPGAVLLRHQAALQPVGEPRHDALQVRELLVEIGAQAVELVVDRRDLRPRRLRRIRREGMVLGTARLVGAAGSGRDGFAGLLVVAEVAVVGHVGWSAHRAASMALSGQLVAGNVAVFFHFHALGVVDSCRLAFLAGLVGLHSWRLSLVVLVEIGARSSPMSSGARRSWTASPKRR